MRISSVGSALLGIGLLACQSAPVVEIRDNFKQYYEPFGVVGAFVLYDEQADKYVFYEQARCQEAVIPASTFKICHSLIALETGVAEDEHFVIPWDSVTRQIPSWNSDHDLKTAFKNSTVWYYQALARRVGEQQMKDWLVAADYGNADITGGIDLFWLTGGLRISAEQQVDFLKRLHHNQLPFSQRSMDIVKSIMVAEESESGVLRAKTGWSEQDGQQIGWYVGYWVSEGKAYYFANLIRANEANDDFVRSRAAIAEAILADLGIRP